MRGVRTQSTQALSPLQTAHRSFAARVGSEGTFHSPAQSWEQLRGTPTGRSQLNGCRNAQELLAHTRVFSTENAHCKDSYRRQCRRNRLLRSSDIDVSQVSLQTAFSREKINTRGLPVQVSCWHSLVRMVGVAHAALRAHSISVVRAGWRSAMLLRTVTPPGPRAQTPARASAADAIRVVSEGAPGGKERTSLSTRRWNGGLAGVF